MGVWKAFLVCLVVCAAWLWVFDWHFKAKMPHNQQMKEEERTKGKSKKKPQRSPVSYIKLNRVFACAHTHRQGRGYNNAA